MKEAQEQAKMQQAEEAGVGINADENLSGTTHLNEPVTNEPEIETLRNELGEMKDKFIRKVAEFENFKKRSLKERMDLIQTAGKEVIADMLEVLDDCERAEKQISTSDDVNQTKEGVMLVFNKLKNILAAKGLKPMETINQDFDPDMHEAITEIPAPTPSAEATSTGCFKPGNAPSNIPPKLPISESVRSLKVRLASSLIRSVARVAASISTPASL